MDQNYYPDRRELQQAYSRQLPVYQAALSELVHRLDSELRQRALSFSLKYRVKSFDSYYQKLLQRIGHAEGEAPDANIQDVLGIRIVCPFLENLKEAEEIMRGLYRIVEVERKGAEHSFREFGYQSTHLLLEIPDELQENNPQLDLDTCEVQIRTILQDAWSEVEHELVYKSNFTPYDESLRRKLAALNANLSLSDLIFQEIRDYQRSLHAELKKRRRSFIDRVEAEISGASPATGTNGAGYELNGVSHFENVDEMLLKALHAHNQGDYTAAIQLYDAILERQIEENVQAVILVHRGMAFFGSARYGEALDNFLAAADLEPENSKTYYYLGIVYRVLNRTTAALSAFKRSLEIYPYYFESLFGLAQTFSELGDYPAALEYCEKAQKIAPEEQKVVRFRAYVLEKMAL
ncbi:MAG TPA: tetratricopeptide repeat protein [Sediminispirochaeta sp.]|nr:tetratricopeptide repeat protein [Sediminispirochaeta sp.]